MYVSISYDGISWTAPHKFHADGIYSSNWVTTQSGISVSPMGINGDWFASYADAEGRIKIVSLPIHNGLVNYNIHNVNVDSILNVRTSVAPALSYLDQSLVLAWIDSSKGNKLFVLKRTSTDNAWADGSAADIVMIKDENTGTIIRSHWGTSPFLHTSGSTVYVTTLESVGPGIVNVFLSKSTDGVQFTSIRNFLVGNSGYGGAAAGPAPTQFALVFPITYGNPKEKSVFTSALTKRELLTRTHMRVTVVGGP
jgi:hypothetical protein